MTPPEQLIRDELLNSRIRRTNAVYARFYGPLCLLTFAMSFFPYYESDAAGSTSYGNLWQEAIRLGPGYDLLALVILLTTALLLVLAATGRLSISGLIAVLVGATIIGCTLWQSPGYVDPPPFSDFGVFDIVLSFLVGALALIHALHLFVLDLAFQRPGD